MIASEQEKRQLWVAKRRVTVQVTLADRSMLDGALYAEPERLDGTRASLLDRLGDVRERFLPLAASDRHVLLHKDRILRIVLPAGELEPPRAAGARELGCELKLSDGAIVSGRFVAILSPAARMLDYLNGISAEFVPLYHPSGEVTLVHVRSIVAVTEKTLA